MSRTLLLRRLIVGTRKIPGKTIRSISSKPESHTRTENENNGKWVALEAYSPRVNGSSVGRLIASRGEDFEDDEKKMSALKWVLICCPHLPRSLVHKLFRLRRVRRQCFADHNAQQLRLKRVGEKDLMNQGDRVFLPISVQESSDKKPRPKPKLGYQRSDEEMSFVRSLVLYKDSAIIAINKPPTMPVQGGSGIKKSVDELAAVYLKYDTKDPPRLVHRLDRGTSGILVMGRTQTSATVLHSIFREKTIGALDDSEINWKKRFLHKRYLALVFGVPKQLNGTVLAPLSKVLVDDGKSERITVADNESTSQHAVTEYKVIQTSKYGFTWLELAPLTGRKHQLRVHCAEVLGTPIVGDYKYGWQPHRKWKPLRCTDLSEHEKHVEPKSNRVGYELECGSISEKQPHLHLHCKQLILPNISAALENASADSNYDFSELDSLNLVAPLPFHMQRSWNLLNSLAHQQDHSE